MLLAIIFMAPWIRTPYYPSISDRSFLGGVLFIFRLIAGTPCRNFSNFCLTQRVLQWWSMRKIYFEAYTNDHYIRDSRVTLEFFQYI